MTAKIFYYEIRCHRPIVAEHAGNYYHEKTNFCSRHNVEILIRKHPILAALHSIQ